MKRHIFFIFLLVIFASTVVAEDYPVCKDTQGPSAVTGLGASGNVQVAWNAAVDTPDCSYVDYYLVYRDNTLINRTNKTSISDGPLDDGTYLYNVIAVDAVGNVGSAAQTSYTLGETGDGLPPSNPSGGGGGGGGSSKKDNDEVEDEKNERDSDDDLDEEELDGEVVDEGIDLEANDIKDENNKESFLGGVTGFFVGEGNKGNLIITLIVLGLLIGGYFWMKSGKEDTAVVQQETKEEILPAEEKSEDDEEKTDSVSPLDMVSDEEEEETK